MLGHEPGQDPSHIRPDHPGDAEDATHLPVDVASAGMGNQRKGASRTLNPTMQTPKP